jgi:hypothetical protein
MAAALVGAGLAAGCTDAAGPGLDRGVFLALSLQAADGVSASEGAALGAAFDRVNRFRVRVEDAVSRALYADTLIRVRAGAAAHELEITVPESAVGATLEVTLTALEGEVELFTASVRATASRGPGGAATEVGVRYTGPGVRGSVVGNDGRGAAGIVLQVLRDGQPVATATTVGDGSYLVMDLPPGRYTVRPPNRAGLTACPAQRTVTLGSATAAAVAAFQYRTGTCTTSVLVLSGGDVDHTGAAAALLAGVADLSTATFFHVNATPGIEALRAYDVVLLFQNGIFDESVGLGSELARYVALGGNVVFGSFYWQGRSDGGLGSKGWGALEELDPFASAGGATYTPSALGTATSHPLTQGVAALTSSGYRGGARARDGATVVATWADGTPLAGYREASAGQRLVALSVYPGHAVVGGVDGDFATLWRNAVIWAGQAGGPARTGPVGGLR